MNNQNQENDQLGTMTLDIPQDSFDALKISSNTTSPVNPPSNISSDLSLASSIGSSSLLDSNSQFSLNNQSIGSFHLSGTNFENFRHLFQQSSQVFDGNSSLLNIGSIGNLQDLGMSLGNFSSSEFGIGLNPELRIDNVKFDVDSMSDKSTYREQSMEIRSPTRGRSATYPIASSSSFSSNSSSSDPVSSLVILSPSTSTNPSNNSSDLTRLTPSTSDLLGQIISQGSKDLPEFMDIAPFVTFPQYEAAKKLNIPSSTLSKKWKDATVNRKWPYRTLAKIDKEIKTIMHNIHRDSNGNVDPQVEQKLAKLLQVRQNETRPVIVRMT